MAEFLVDTVREWRANPIRFIETVLNDPETKKPFQLLDAERRFLEHAFKLDDDGRMFYPEQVYSCPKKSGKTTYAAIHTLTMILLFGGAYPEATLCANDQEQAQGRVYTMVRRIITCSPKLRAIAKITDYKITFPTLNATITAISSSFAGAAGGNQNISVFDESWAYTSERSRRLWDEMIPPPTRKVGCRLTVTYAGFEGESLLLEGLYKRGLQQPQIGPDLYAGDGLLMFWSHTPIAPWQDARWLDEMRRSLRPSAYQRLVLNEFASAESAFIDMSAWDACVQQTLSPPTRATHVWVGVDASVKRDSTALVAVTIDKKTKVARLIAHAVFTPRANDPISFELIEQTILDWNKRFVLRKVWCDPFQMTSVVQRLVKAHIPIEEYPQTVPNLTAATQNLFDMVQSRSIALYPDDAMRLAVSRAIIVESSRGWRLDKMKQHHHIDVIVALSMACLAAVRGAEEHFYPHWSSPVAQAAWGDGPSLDAPIVSTEEQKRIDKANFERAQLRAHIYNVTGHLI